MKYLWLFLSLNLFAMEPTQQEVSQYLSRVGEINTTDQVLQSSHFQNCREENAEIEDLDERREKVRECFEEKLSQTSDEEIQQLGSDLELNGYNLTSSGTSQEIRTYLSSRLRDAIYGDNSDELDILEKRTVTQDIFFDLYKAQLGKNSLLDITKYCVENLRDTRISEDPRLIRPCVEAGNPAGCQSYEIPVFGQVQQPGSDRSLIIELPYQAQESQQVQEKIREEFAFGAEYLKRKFSVCTKSISLMCDYYECKNTVTSADAPQCKQLFGDAWTPDVTTDSLGEDQTVNATRTKTNKGSIACLYREKLQNYRKSIAALDETKQKMQQASSSENSVNFDRGVLGEREQYTGGGSQTSINQIVTIGSKEITQNDAIASLKNVEEKAEELREKCLENNNDPECQEIYMANREEIANIQSEIEARTALGIREIRSMADNKEELEQYLRDNGMEGYIDNLGDMPDEELANLIESKYRAKRQALLDSLDQVHANEETDQVSDTQQVQTVTEATVENAITEVENSNRRIQNILEYNNIITSFLSTNDEEGISMEGNNQGLIAERNAENEFGDEESQEARNEYFEELSGEGENSFSSGDTLYVEAETLDQVIFYSPDDDDDDSRQVAGSAAP